MNSSNLTKDLSTDKSVCIWKYIHEMSHTFDGIEGSQIGNTWNFDSELFANLKMLYVMENNGLSFQDSSEKGADAYLKYSAGNTLKNGIYSSDGFLYLLIYRLREVQPDYWNSLQAVFSNARFSPSDMVKLSLLMDSSISFGVTKKEFRVQSTSS